MNRGMKVKTPGLFGAQSGFRHRWSCIYRGQTEGFAGRGALGLYLQDNGDDNMMFAF